MNNSFLISSLFIMGHMHLNRFQRSKVRTTVDHLLGSMISSSSSPPLSSSDESNEGVDKEDEGCSDGECEQDVYLLSQSFDRERNCNVCSPLDLFSGQYITYK
jgi:hypothetical protein